MVTLVCVGTCSLLPPALMGLGVTVSFWPMALPVSATVVPPRPPATSAVSVAERCPPAMGANLTVTVKLTPGPMAKGGAKMPKSTVKSPGLIPLMMTLETVTPWLPLLVKVTICGAPTAPTPTSGKVSAGGCAPSGPARASPASASRHTGTSTT